MAKVSGPRSEQVYLRVTPQEKALLEADASREERHLSDIIYRAVRMYLAGGADAWARAERERAAAQAAAQPSDEDRKAMAMGRALLDLDEEVRIKIVEAGAGLQAIYDARRAGRPGLPELVGRVRNILVPADTEDTPSRGGRQRSGKR